MLEVQKFMNEHSDWREILSNAPYSLIISDDVMYGRDLVLLKYNQIESDFGNAIVRECRGLILDAHTHEVVCHPFHKFFNYGEVNQAEIDWSTAFTSSKLDGSLMKVVRLGDDFLISTNGVIDAWKCNLPENVLCPFHTFGELFMEGMKHYGLGMDDFGGLFKEGFTYMFELTSPWNQVVVQWSETKVSLIGVRDNASGMEIKFSEHELSKVFDTPRIYPITSVDECVAAAKELPENEEGYVVCDANFNRIKIKSPRYVQLHYMAGNQVWSAYRVMEILLANEVSEYVAYFPKFKDAYDKVNDAYQGFIVRVRDFQVLIDGMNFPNKKDFAMWVMGDANRRQMQGFAFKYYEGKVKDADEWVKGLRIQQVLDILGM